MKCPENGLGPGPRNVRQSRAPGTHSPTATSIPGTATRQTTTFPPSTPPNLTPPDRPHPAITPPANRRSDAAGRPNPPHSASETMPLSSLTSDRAVDSPSYKEHLDASKAKQGKGRRVPRETLPLHEHATPPQLPKIAPPEPHTTTLATIRHVTKRTNAQGGRNLNPVSFRDASEPSSPPRQPSVHYDESDARHGGVARH